MRNTLLAACKSRSAKTRCPAGRKAIGDQADPRTAARRAAPAQQMSDPRLTRRHLLEWAGFLMALGAVEAIAAAGRTGKIRVVGFDALDDAKKAIADGTMAASVAQFPAEMGRVAVESAVKVINGESLPADVKVKLELVTKETLGGTR